jgi:hypothetical protein
MAQIPWTDHPIAGPTRGANHIIFLRDREYFLLRRALAHEAAASSGTGNYRELQGIFGLFFAGGMLPRTISNS